MTTVQSHRRVSIGDLGWSFSATLVALFVLCMLAALFMPLRLAHGWVNLLSDAPIHSSRVWVEGSDLECRAWMAGRRHLWHDL